MRQLKRQASPSQAKGIDPHSPSERPPAVSRSPCAESRSLAEIGHSLCRPVLPTRCRNLAYRSNGGNAAYGSLFAPNDPGFLLVRNRNLPGRGHHELAGFKVIPPASSKTAPSPSSTSGSVVSVQIMSSPSGNKLATTAHHLAHDHHVIAAVDPNREHAVSRFQTFSQFKRVSSTSFSSASNVISCCWPPKSRCPLPCNGARTAFPAAPLPYNPAAHA